METTRSQRPLGVTHQFHGLQPVLRVRNARAAYQYYCATLGFEPDFFEDEPAPYGRVRIGDRTFGDPVFIHIAEGPASHLTDEEMPTTDLRIHVGIDLDGLFRSYERLGVHIEIPPRTRPWGLRELEVRDLDGNLLVFCEHGSDS